MSRLIDADELIGRIEEITSTDMMKVLVESWITAQPTYKTDSYVEQLRWERDVAISQLEKLGIGFGEKVDDKVVISKLETTTKSKGSD